MTTLYFDATAGAAGDMIVAALLDAGVPEAVLSDAFAALPLPGAWAWAAGETSRGGVRAARFHVQVTDEGTERRYEDVVRIVHESGLLGEVKARVLRTFEVLGRAESRIHGLPIEQVHLHEVGASDSIADVVGACAAIEHLRPANIVCSPVRLGGGTTAGGHGAMPAPAPATLDILAGVPVLGGGEGETVTPTGAALLVANCDGFGDVPPMTLRAVGYGAGARDTEMPNVTRVLVGDESGVTAQPEAVVIEANVDDMSPELLAPLIDSLIASGAADAWLTPIVMKKGRPAFTVSALTTHDSAERVADTMFRESTTFGIRTSRVGKEALEREWAEVTVAGEALRVKVARRGGTITAASPEHEDALRVSRTTGIPLKEVYRAAVAAYEAGRTVP